jgi:hypothetical protein
MVEYDVYLGRRSASQSTFPLLELGTFDNVYPVYMPGTAGAGMPCRIDDATFMSPLG